MFSHFRGDAKGMHNQSARHDQQSSCLIQPYCPMLLPHGMLPGPSLLYPTQKGEPDEKALHAAWREAGSTDAPDKRNMTNWTWNTPLPCRHYTFIHTFESFGDQADVWQCLEHHRAGRRFDLLQMSATPVRQEK